jgi:hypothetical protein
MRTESLFSEEIDDMDEGEEQCPECGHIWVDDQQNHYHDCRYFVLSAEEDEDDFFNGEGEASKNIKSWEFRPAA